MKWVNKANIEKKGPMLGFKNPVDVSNTWLYNLILPLSRILY
jgi:hypothetical protein